MRIGWGVIGAGSVARRRTMPSMKAIDSAELVAVMVRDKERARAIASEYGAKRSYTDVLDLLSDGEIDAVYISTPVAFHKDHAVAALRAGKHVLLEKPMARTVRECDEIIEEARKSGKHLQICFIMRFHPAYREIKGMVESGEFGEIVMARAQMMKWYDIEPGSWRLDPEISGGGVLIDVGSHLLDLMAFLLGDISEISAIKDSRVRGWRIEETATVVGRTSDGVQIVISTSYNTPYSETILEIYGTKGSVYIYALPDGKGWLMKWRTNAGSFERIWPPIELFELQLDHFAKCIEGIEDPLVTGEDGRKNIGLIMAAYRSAERGYVEKVGRGL
jgi:predicted dehydrogenase